MKKHANLQDSLLNELRKGRIDTIVFTTNGAQIRGHIISYDSYTILVKNEKNQLNLLYKHAVSTIAPLQEMEISGIIKDDVNHPTV